MDIIWTIACAVLTSSHCRVSPTLGLWFALLRKASYLGRENIQLFIGGFLFGCHSIYRDLFQTRHSFSLQAQWLFLDSTALHDYSVDCRWTDRQPTFFSCQLVVNEMQTAAKRSWLLIYLMAKLLLLLLRAHTAARQRRANKRRWLLHTKGLHCAWKYFIRLFPKKKLAVFFLGILLSLELFFPGRTTVANPIYLAQCNATNTSRTPLIETIDTYTVYTHVRTQKHSNEWVCVFFCLRCDFFSFPLWLSKMRRGRPSNGSRPARYPLGINEVFSKHFSRYHDLVEKRNSLAYFYQTIIFRVSTA